MTKKWQRTAMLAAVVILCASGAIADFAGKRTLQLDGSTTVGPIADAFAEAFMNTHKDISITVNKTGSGDGAAALIEGRCDIATMSRFMKEKEFKKAVAKGVMPVAHVVAMDGVCVVVHPSNPVKGLSTEQLRKIYKGEITNWREIGGADAPIVAITRDSSSGTYETFHKLVMKKQQMSPSVETVGSNAQAHGRVASSPNAIGYVGFAFLDRKVKALTVDGSKPTIKAIRSGAYPIARPLFMFTNGYPKLGSIVHQFVTFHLSERGQQILEKKGFIPLTDY